MSSPLADCDIITNYKKVIVNCQHGKGLLKVVYCPQNQQISHASEGKESTIMNVLSNSFTVSVHPALQKQENLRKMKQGGEASECIEKLSRMEGPLEKNAIRSMRFYG